MPEAAPEKESPAPASAGGGTMTGIKGWIIVGAVVVLEAVGFLLFIHFGNTPPENPTDTHKTGRSLKHDPSRVHSLNNLTYVLNAGAPRTEMSMNVTLVFDYTANELNNPDADYVPLPAILDEYPEYAKNLDVYLRDHLAGYMQPINPNETRSPGLRLRIKDEIKTYMNQMLQNFAPTKAPANMDRNRVTDVLLELTAQPVE